MALLSVLSPAVDPAAVHYKAVDRLLLIQYCSNFIWNRVRSLFCYMYTVLSVISRFATITLRIAGCFIVIVL